MNGAKMTNSYIHAKTGISYSVGGSFAPLASDAPLHALEEPSPAGLSREEKLVWILGDMMNAVENYFGAENPKRLGHINSAAIRIIDEVLNRP
jgi:hypothetical protein